MNRPAETLGVAIPIKQVLCDRFGGRAGVVLIHRNQVQGNLPLVARRKVDFAQAAFC